MESIIEKSTSMTGVDRCAFCLRAMGYDPVQELVVVHFTGGNCKANCGNFVTDTDAAAGLLRDQLMEQEYLIF